jgi:hypothetical protein
MDTTKERKRSARLRDRAMGLREILVKVPERDVAEIRALARKRMAQWRQEHGE